MNRDEATEAVNTFLDYYRTVFRLHNWTFFWQFERLEGDDLDSNIKADICVRPDRWRAEIRIDLDHITSIEDLNETVRHELLHVVAWPMEQMASFADSIIPSEYTNPWEHVKSASTERMVAALEHMLDLGLALTPEKTVLLAQEK